VSEETRKVLLGHKNGDITTHYSAAELADLITAVNKIDRSLETPGDNALTHRSMKKCRTKSSSKENRPGAKYLTH